MILEVRTMRFFRQVLPEWIAKTWFRILSVMTLRIFFSTRYRQNPLGNAGESLASQFLKAKGYKIITVIIGAAKEKLILSHRMVPVSFHRSSKQEHLQLAFFLKIPSTTPNKNDLSASLIIIFSIISSKNLIADLM